MGTPGQQLLDPGVAAAEGAPARGRESDLVGRVFDGKFLIQRLIGVGGFGAVYSARDLELECGVAIKILHREVAADAANFDGFIEEVRRLTRLKHPNVVGWKALAHTADRSAYLVMELLEGRELGELLQEEATLPPQRAARILLQIFDALRAAHRLPDGDCLLHLDLKPANVFLEAHPSGRTDLDWVKVIDFGISQYLGADAEPSEGERPRSLLTTSAPGLTTRRRTIGEAAITQKRRAVRTGGCQACTPDYAAPEQGAHFLPDVDAPSLDERADLYAVGVIGFRMVTGKLPFGEVNQPEALLRAKLQNDAPPVETFAPKVPRRLARFIDRCLERDREARFRTADEAYAALDAIVNPRLGRKSIAIGASAAVLLALSGWLLRPPARPNRFELFEPRGTEEQLLTEKSVLFFGPARRELPLRITGVTLAPADRLRLVQDPRPDAPTIEGWSAREITASTLEVHADLLDARVRQPAYLEVQKGGGERRWSAPLKLAWLGKEAVSIRDVVVPSRGERAVDPNGLELEIHVDADPDDLDKVEVSCGGPPLLALLDRSRSTPSDGVYVLPLDSLQPSESSPELEVRVTDLSGNERRTRARFAFVPSPLSYEEKPRLEGAQKTGSSWFVADLTAARLAFKTSGTADVDLLLLDDNGKQLDRESLAKTKEGDFELSKFQHLDPGDHGFRGSIELHADDRSYVLHKNPADRGALTSRIDFFLSKALPEIKVALSPESGANPVPLEAKRPYFTKSPKVQVHLERSPQVPVRVAVVDHSSARGPAAPEGETTLVSPSDTQHVFDVDLKGAGTHDLSILCWRCVDDGDRRRAPDVELSARCVVVTAAPELALAPVESEEASNAAGVWPAGAKLHLGDATPKRSSPPIPIQLRFELVRENRPTPLVAQGEIPGVFHPAGMVELRLPLPVDVAPALPLTDGRYVLRLLATDAAGNESRPAELAVEVAKSGPAFDLKLPAKDLTWQPDPHGVYEIRATAEDANGVAKVTAALSIAGVAPIEVAMVAENVAPGATYSEWSGRARIPRSWTSHQLELRFTASDGRGRTTERVERRNVGSIDRAAPVCVQVRRGGASLGAMRLVRGNHESPYVFGGRSDDTEEKLFNSVGLGTYNRLKFSKSWESSFAKDEIPDYYLDEREVTVADFLHFLGDERGFADAALWPKGARPDPARRTSLQSLLKGLPPEQPVTQVNWDEASAFARWCGKRLPSFVEWEFALRGGPQYRACAAGRPPARDAGAAAAPVPAGVGTDVTSDTHLWNLTGNVAEWSATPAGSPEERDAGSPATFAAANPAWFLRTANDDAARAGSFWVVGASFRHARAEFSIADERRRDWHGPDVGFRCAAALEEVVDRLEVNDPGRALFTEGDGE